MVLAIGMRDTIKLENLRLTDGCRWGVALSTRSGPEYLNYPMGRETIMVPVTWNENEFPVWSSLSGEMSGWEFPQENLELDGTG